MRVATVSFYYGPITEGAWTMFKPEVVSTFVSDPAEIQRVLASISDEEWCALEEHLGRIPSKRPGLYKMWPPHNGQLTPMPRELKVAFIAIGILVLIVGASIATAIKLGRNSSTSGTASPTPLGGPARGTPQTAPPFNRSFPAAGPRNAGRPAQSEFGRIAVGDKVEVLDMRTGRWSPATTAELDGFRFRVRYDEGSRAEEWVPRGQLRPRR
jgi:hypothetical protein